jgi:hypothetical protein
MKRRTCFLLFVLFFYSLLWIQPRRAYACSSGLGPDYNFDEADAVFAGRVTAIRRPLQLSATTYRLNRLLPDIPAFDPYYRRVLFTTTTSWKGVSTTEAMILTPNSHGYPFDVGKEYLVYARRIQNHFVTTGCVAPLEAADPTFIPTGPSLSLTTPFPWSTVFYGLSAVAVLGLGWRTWRKRKRESTP